MSRWFNSNIHTAANVLPLMVVKARQLIIGIRCSSAAQMICRPSPDPSSNSIKNLLVVNKRLQILGGHRYTTTLLKKRKRPVECFVLIILYRPKTDRSYTLQVFRNWTPICWYLFSYLFIYFREPIQNG